MIEKGSSERHNDGDNLLSDDDDNEEYCGVCGTLYEEETDEIEKWIACNDCGTWYHWKCTNIIKGVGRGGSGGSDEPAPFRGRFFVN